MNTISMNLNVPQGWHEPDDAQLLYVYSLIANLLAGFTKGYICQGICNSVYLPITTADIPLAYNSRYTMQSKTDNRRVAGSCHLGGIIMPSQKHRKSHKGANKLS